MEAGESRGLERFWGQDWGSGVRMRGFGDAFGLVFACVRGAGLGLPPRVGAAFLQGGEGSLGTLFLQGFLRIFRGSFRIDLIAGGMGFDAQLRIRLVGTERGRGSLDGGCL